jgi:hypothetical protein
MTGGVAMMRHSKCAGDGWKVPMAADAAATCRQRHRVAIRLPGAIARVEPHQVDVRELSEMNLGKSKHRRQWRGNGNEGVGEHVRTRFHLGLLGPVKLRSSQGDPHRTKKNLFLLPDRFLKERALSKIRSSRLT